MMRNSGRIEIKGFVIVLSMYAEVVEPGRHARLRGVWGNPCGFKSRLRHHSFLLKSSSERFESVKNTVNKREQNISVNKNQRRNT